MEIRSKKDCPIRFWSFPIKFVTTMIKIVIFLFFQQCYKFGIPKHIANFQYVFYNLLVHTKGAIQKTNVCKKNHIKKKVCSYMIFHRYQIFFWKMYEMSLHIMALLQLSTLALQFAPENLRQTGLLYCLRHCLPKCLEKILQNKLQLSMYLVLCIEYIHS